MHSHFQAKALGKVLFEQVCRQLNLLEADYFGLEYQETTSNVKVSLQSPHLSNIIFERNSIDFLFLLQTKRLAVLVRSRKTNKSTSWPIARRAVA